MPDYHMDIFDITTQPNFGSVVNKVVCDYRQIRFVCRSNGVYPPFVPMYADVYFSLPFAPYVFTNYTFYKTLIAYSIDSDGGSPNRSLYMFDIQDAVQEFLQTFIPTLPYTGIVQTDSALPFSNVGVQVYFRGSDIVGGILTPMYYGSVPPQQATATTPAVSPYEGQACHPFIACNASILPDYGSIYQNEYETFLSRRQVIDIFGFIAGTRIYPLSNLPLNLYTTPVSNLAPSNFYGYNGYLPILILQFGVFSSTTRLSRSVTVEIQIFKDGATLMSTYILMSAFTLGTGTYYLPIGIAEIAALSTSAINDLININNDTYYRILVIDIDALGVPCFVSPMFKYSSPAIETTCLWFQNMHGHFEQITFVRSDTSHTTKSAEVFVPYTQEIAIGLNNPLAIGKKRYNARSSDEISLTATFNEELMLWVEELIDSPYVLMQVINPTQSFIAVEVIDGSFEVKKTTTKAGIKYTTTLKVKPAIDRIIPRN